MAIGTSPKASLKALVRQEVLGWSEGKSERTRDSEHIMLDLLEVDGPGASPLGVLRLYWAYKRAIMKAPHVSVTGSESQMA